MPKSMIQFTNHEIFLLEQFRTRNKQTFRDRTRFQVRVSVSCLHVAHVATTLREQFKPGDWSKCT